MPHKSQLKPLNVRDRSQDSLGGSPKQVEQLYRDVRSLTKEVVKKDKEILKL
jgi:hypothetical protein